MAAFEELSMNIQENIMAEVDLVRQQNDTAVLARTEEPGSLPVKRRTTTKK